MLSIRQALNSDINVIASLSRQTFSDTFSQQNTVEDMRLHLENNFNDRVVASELADANNLFLIAEQDQNPIAYAKLVLNSPFPLKEDESGMEISRIYCMRETIGSGVGQLLLNKCLDVAHQNNCAVTWLGVWEENERAIKFYLKNGFKKAGEQIFKLGNDTQNDWLMIKMM